MKRLSLIIAAVLMVLALPTKAQKAQSQEYDYEFNPHWFIQGQAGGQYTLGERNFKDLTSLNFQLGGGYEFNPYLAARLSVNAYQSKAGMSKFVVPGGGDYQWKWNYIAPSIDGMLDITNLFGGFNPERKLSFGVLAGLGVNIVFNKDEAVDQKAAIVQAYANNGVAMNQEYLKYAGETGPFLTLRLGSYLDFHLTENLALGLELQANATSDKYNSKDGDNLNDWYFNGLIGIKYCFGKTNEKTPKEQMIPVSNAANYADCPEPAEKIVEKLVDNPVEVTVPTLYEEIYFDLNKDKIAQSEKYKVRHMIEFLKDNPNATIEISGNADKATGTHQYNQAISQRRADNVAQALKDAGIAESRITVIANGDTKNIYEGADMKLNRVCICIGK